MTRILAPILILLAISLPAAANKSARCEQLMKQFEVFAMNRLHQMRKPPAEHRRLANRIRHTFKIKKAAFLKKCRNMKEKELASVEKEVQDTLSGKKRRAIAP